MRGLAAWLDINNSLEDAVVNAIDPAGADADAPSTVVVRVTEPVSAGYVAAMERDVRDVGFAQQESASR
jgi:hypothetical protein